MILLGMSWALGCDLEALSTGTKALGEGAGPAEAGALLAAACPRPQMVRKALLDPSNPDLDLHAATGHAEAWVRACPAGLAVLPEGFEHPSPGDRIKIWSGCELESRGLMEADEWMAGSGPPLVSILMADRLEQEGLDLEVRQPLLRALAGVPMAPRETDTDALTADPFAGLRPVSDPRVVQRAQVVWPLDVDPDTVCSLRLDIRSDGTLAKTKWLDCPEVVRGPVSVALGQSWFEAARRNHQPTRGSLTLEFKPPPTPEPRE